MAAERPEFETEVRAARVERVLAGVLDGPAPTAETPAVGRRSADGASASPSAPTTAGSRSSRRSVDQARSRPGGRSRTAAPTAPSRATTPTSPTGRPPGGQGRVHLGNHDRRGRHRLGHGGQQGAGRPGRCLLRPVDGPEQPGAQSGQRAHPRGRAHRCRAGLADRPGVAGHAVGRRPPPPAGGPHRRDRRDLRQERGHDRSAPGP